MIDKIVIHCSATPNGRHTTAEDIHTWHLQKNFDGIGYHHVIRTDGVLESGRPHYWKGSHAYGRNEDSLGICMIGTDFYSVQQWAILDDLLRKLLIQYPGAKIMGHNELSNKKCPGFDVQWWLKNIFNKNLIKGNN